jgi:bacterioferritin-associated ferredoxin
MIVCLCEGVNDVQLRSAIAQGATSVRALCQQTRAGSHCGMCVCDLKQLVDESKPAQRRSSKPDLLAK